MCVYYYTMLWRPSDFSDAPGFPNADEVLPGLSPLLAHLQDTLPILAREKVLPAYRDISPHALDKALFAHELRFWLHPDLKALSNCRGDRECYMYGPFRMCSIQGVFRGQYGFLLRRLLNGGVPPPSDSIRQHKFYSQQRSGLTPQQTGPNIVVAWSAQYPFDQFDLYIALPTGVEADGTVILHFFEPVPLLTGVEQTEADSGQPIDPDIRPRDDHNESERQGSDDSGRAHQTNAGTSPPDSDATG